MTKDSAGPASWEVVIVGLFIDAGARRQMAADRYD